MGSPAITISTRRFSTLPASVALETIGRAVTRPWLAFSARYLIRGSRPQRSAAEAAIRQRNDQSPRRVSGGQHAVQALQQLDAQLRLGALPRLRLRRRGRNDDGRLYAIGLGPVRAQPRSSGIRFGALASGALRFGLGVRGFHLRPRLLHR